MADRPPRKRTTRRSAKTSPTSTPPQQHNDDVPLSQLSQLIDQAQQQHPDLSQLVQHDSTAAEANEEMQTCSQCKKPLPFSRFYRRATTLAPMAVCMSHQWYWTKERRAVLAPEENSTTAQIQEQLRGIVASASSTSKAIPAINLNWVVLGAEADRGVIVNTISQALSTTQLVAVPYRKSRASNKQAAPSTHHFLLHSDHLPVLRLSITLNPPSDKFVIFLKAEEEKAPGFGWRKKRRSEEGIEGDATPASSTPAAAPTPPVADNDAILVSTVLSALRKSPRRQPASPVIKVSTTPPTTAPISTEFTPLLGNDISVHDDLPVSPSPSKLDPPSSSSLMPPPPVPPRKSRANRTRKAPTFIAPLPSTSTTPSTGHPPPQAPTLPHPGPSPKRAKITTAPLPFTVPPLPYPSIPALRIPLHPSLAHTNRHPFDAFQYLQHSQPTPSGLSPSYLAATSAAASGSSDPLAPLTLAQLLASPFLGSPPLPKSKRAVKFGIGGGGGVGGSGDTGGRVGHPAGAEEEIGDSESEEVSSSEEESSSEEDEGEEQEEAEHCADVDRDAEGADVQAADNDDDDDEGDSMEDDDESIMPSSSEEGGDELSSEEDSDDDDEGDRWLTGFVKEHLIGGVPDEVSPPPNFASELGHGRGNSESYGGRSHLTTQVLA